MGAVYEVVDQTTNSRRALKVMLPSAIEDSDLRDRFALEARVTGDIESDHIVRISDAGIDHSSGMPFLVMDLLRGQELGGMIKRLGALSPIDVVTYLFQTSLALDKAHAAAIVHRDLKPANLFVTYRDDGSPCVKILDFGIAKIAAQSTGYATRPVGTPLYMAPEQLGLKGRIQPRSDIYALGQVAYALLVGEPYWTQELKASDSIFPLLSQINTGIPELPSARAERRRGVALPPTFDRWFLKATALDPNDRFDRATTAIIALAEALGTPTPKIAPSLGDSLNSFRIYAEPSVNLGIDSSPQAVRTGTAAASVMSQPVSPPRHSPLTSVAIAVFVAAGVVMTWVFLLRPALHVRTATDVPSAAAHDAPPPASESARPEGRDAPAGSTRVAPAAEAAAPASTTITRATAATAAPSAAPKGGAPSAKRKTPAPAAAPAEKPRTTPRAMF